MAISPDQNTKNEPSVLGKIKLPSAKTEQGTTSSTDTKYKCFDTVYKMPSILKPNGKVE